LKAGGHSDSIQIASTRTHFRIQDEVFFLQTFVASVKHGFQKNNLLKILLNDDESEK